MLPPAGLYVSKTAYDDDKKSPNYGCTVVWWGASDVAEAFNPYYTWYVDNRCKLCDEPDPHNCAKEKENHNG